MNLLAIRKEHRMSQNRLSKLSGVSQAHLSDIEAGKKSPTLATLEKIAVALNMTVSQILNEEEN